MGLIKQHKIRVDFLFDNSSNIINWVLLDLVIPIEIILLKMFDNNEIRELHGILSLITVTSRMTSI